MDGTTSVMILGTRGTTPVEGEKMARYGGSTACVLVRLGKETLILDGGTGIQNLAQQLRPQEKTLHLLLSHPHVDHMLGLPAWQVFFDSRYQVHLYGAQRDGRTPREQLARLMSPPLWPVGQEAFTAAVEYHAVCDVFHIGAVRVRVLEGNHPGGCSVFRLEHGDISVVYASDYELDDTSFAPLADFARGCTLLLCDGQYSPEEQETYRGFGHSTWTAVAELACACGAAGLRVVHHAPWRTDEALDRATAQLRQQFTDGAFARRGEEIIL